jgi:hypothetical protein
MRRSLWAQKGGLAAHMNLLAMIARNLSFVLCAAHQINLGLRSSSLLQMKYCH